MLALLRLSVHHALDTAELMQLWDKLSIEVQDAILTLAWAVMAEKSPGLKPSMCNLYSVMKDQAAIRAGQL